MSEIDRESNVAKEGMRDLKNKVEEEKKKQMRKWIVTFVIQHFVTIAMIFGGAIIALVVVASIGEILGLFGGNGNTVYAEEAFSQYGNNTGYWFPILKSDIPSNLFTSTGGLPKEKGQGIITSDFGSRTAPTSGASTNHGGIDISFANINGKKVIATKDGTVKIYENAGNSGNYIDLNHGDGTSSQYLHLSGFAVENGASVRQGDVIGYVGNTGVGTGPHLHFQIKINGTKVNPKDYLDFSNPWPDPVTTSAGERKTSGSVVYDPEFALQTTPPTDDMIESTFNARTTCYDLCYYCCEKTKDNSGWGVTASGIKLAGGEKVVAADSSLPFGTWLYIEGVGYYMVADRGGAIKDKNGYRRLDIFMGMPGDKVGDSSKGTAGGSGTGCWNAPASYARVKTTGSNSGSVKVYVIKPEYCPK